jgi:hypothetical protein
MLRFYDRHAAAELCAGHAQHVCATPTAGPVDLKSRNLIILNQGNNLKVEYTAAGVT